MKTFGKVTFDQTGSKFYIKCEPHVSIRLKRVFGKLGEHSFGTHVIKATEENGRDLDWFLDRYPLEMDEMTRYAIDQLSGAHTRAQEFIEDFYRSQYQPLAFDLSIPAREYQKEAAQFWLRVKRYILGDDVGLGKTISAIAGLTHKELLPSVVVTLANTMPQQWEGELNRFAPHLKTHVIKRGTPYPMIMPDVYIINYHKLGGWAETLAKVAKSVIFDEAQELRRSESSGQLTVKYGAAKHLAAAAEYVIGLSATPIYNYGGEFYNVIDAIAPGKLGDHIEFYREWCGGSYYGKPRIAEPKAFGSYLKDSGIMLRRTRAEVKREIPAVSKFHQTVESDTKALDNVSNACAELARLILAQGETQRGDKMRASEEFSNILRQATGIAKAPYVANFVKLLVENGEKVLLGGWHRAVYQIWKEILAEYNPVLFTGSESPSQKLASKQAFLSGESQVMMMSLRSGAGLDGLQYACKTIVFGELDWSPEVHEQFIGRVARDGQPDPVCAYFLVAEEGADPVIVDVLGVKKTQVEGVINHDKPLFERVHRDSEHIKRLAQSYLQKEPV